MRPRRQRSQLALQATCASGSADAVLWCACRRDIKLENTLLDAAQPLPNVKLCDFGYSKNEFVDSRPKTVSGTPDYIAPEVLLNDQYDGMKADIWSCGVMLYVMLTGALQLVPETFGLQSCATTLTNTCAPQRCCRSPSAATTAATTWCACSSSSRALWPRTTSSRGA